MPLPKLSGRALQLGRTLCGLSQRDLAIASQISQLRLWRIEQDQEAARPGELARILKVMVEGKPTR